MALTGTDILIKLSVAAAAGNTTVSTPAASLGDQISTTQISGTALNNLFDDVSGDESAAGDIEYRCLFVHNNHGSLPWTSVVVYLSAETAGGSSMALATDNIASSAVGAASAQADVIANEDTAPTGVSAFSSPTTKAAGLSLGTINAGSVKAFWVKRTTSAATAAANNDGGTIAVAGDTAA